jgi:hypothetical protein
LEFAEITISAKSYHYGRDRLLIHWFWNDIEQYALKKASYIIVRLVQQFARVESRDPREWQEKLSLTCFSRNGVKVGLVPARDESYDWDRN